MPSTLSPPCLLPFKHLNYYKRATSDRYMPLPINSYLPQCHQHHGIYWEGGEWKVWGGQHDGAGWRVVWAAAADVANKCFFPLVSYGMQKEYLRGILYVRVVGLVHLAYMGYIWVLLVLAGVGLGWIAFGTVILLLYLCVWVCHVSIGISCVSCEYEKLCISWLVLYVPTHLPNIALSSSLMLGYY